MCRQPYRDRHFVTTSPGCAGLCISIDSCISASFSDNPDSPHHVRLHFQSGRSLKLHTCIGKYVKLKIAMTRYQMMGEIQTDIPCEVDGEICLSPNSAEGKALQRIRNPILEDEWITVFDPETDPLDEAALDAWLSKRGYPLQDTDTSVSQH